MLDTVVESLILDLLEWLADGERSYDAVMEAWRTSCPRLPVWEEANDRGLVTTGETDGSPVARITPLGLEVLSRRKPRGLGFR
jgi:D-3-phosphoglycerate dehydrogenase